MKIRTALRWDQIVGFLLGPGPGPIIIKLLLERERERESLRESLFSPAQR